MSRFWIGVWSHAPEQPPGYWDPVVAQWLADPQTPDTATAQVWTDILGAEVATQGLAVGRIYDADAQAWGPWIDPRNATQGQGINGNIFQSCPGAGTQPPAGAQPFPTSSVTPPIRQFAVDTLDSHIASNDPPLYGYRLKTIGGENYMAFVTKHTVCNGVPGCCDAVTIYKWTGPMPGSGGGGGPTPPGINWPVVAVTGAAAVAVVIAFRAALKHAGRRHA